MRQSRPARVRATTTHSQPSQRTRSQVRPAREKSVQSKPTRSSKTRRGKASLQDDRDRLLSEGSVGQVSEKAFSESPSPHSALSTAEVPCDSQASLKTSRNSRGDDTSTSANPAIAAAENHSAPPPPEAAEARTLALPRSLQRSSDGEEAGSLACLSPASSLQVASPTSDGQFVARKSTRPTKMLCMLFLRGKCENGVNCVFSHDASPVHEGAQRKSVDPVSPRRVRAKSVPYQVQIGAASLPMRTGKSKSMFGWLRRSVF
jgi:hypothetical protein